MLEVNHDLNDIDLTQKGLGGDEIDKDGETQLKKNQRRDKKNCAATRKLVCHSRYVILIFDKLCSCLYKLLRFSVPVKQDLDSVMSLLTDYVGNGPLSAYLLNSNRASWFMRSMPFLLNW